MTSYMLRDVPEDLHRAVRVDAARRGITMRELMLQLMAAHVVSSDTTSAIAPEVPQFPPARRPNPSLAKD
jgi:plasmid stability protein